MLKWDPAKITQAGLCPALSEIHWHEKSPTDTKSDGAKKQVIIFL
jgi:hypothetical protein